MAGRPKGYPKTGGRGKGVPNKVTASVKEKLNEVFHLLQEPGQPYSLLEWAKDNPTEFYRLSARLIPTDIKTEFNGSDGERQFEITLKI